MSPLMWQWMFQQYLSLLKHEFLTLKKTKTIPKMKQGSSNAQKKYILKHTYTHRKIGHICWPHCNPPATSCLWVKNQGVCVVNPSPLSFSVFFGHHDKTDEHIVVTSETVNANTENAQPRGIIPGLRWDLTGKKTKRLPNLKHSVSKIISLVGLWSVGDTKTVGGRWKRGRSRFMTTYGFSFSIHSRVQSDET